MSNVNVLADLISSKRSLPVLDMLAAGWPRWRPIDGSERAANVRPMQ
jgi:hypothetical protein